METERLDAEAALALVERSRIAAVRRSRSPWWYGPATGLLFGTAWTLTLLEPRGTVSAVVRLIMIIGISVLGRLRVRATGARFVEWRPARVGLATLVTLLLLVAVLCVSVPLVWRSHLEWVAWVAGASLFLVLTASPLVLDRVRQSADADGA